MISKVAGGPATGRLRAKEIPSYQRQARGEHDEPSQSRERLRAVLAVLSAAQFLTVLDL
jgi:hypothetical protein